MEGIVSPQFLHNPKATVSTVGYGDDSGVHAIFDDEFVKNEYRSETEGRAVYDHYFSVELQWPGDNTKTFKYRFSPQQAERGNEYTERFPRQWAAFRNSTQQTPDGTPIEMWPPLDKKKVFELKANKIFTVEQIAALTDQTGPNIGLEWRKMRDQAEAFLNPAASTVQISKLTRENEDLRNKIDALEQRFNSMGNSQDTQIVQAVPEKKKPGRKPNIPQKQAA